MPAQKAADVLATKAQYADPFTALLQGLRANALHLTGDARRDLDGIVLHTDTADPSRAVFLGTWQGRLRLYGGLEVVGVEAELVLLATKGSTEVDLANPQFGMSGPEIGNSVLIAAVFHVAIFYLRASGLLVMKNQPYDARVRKKYELMGFIRGERLPLDRATDLENAFGYVEVMYGRHHLSLRRAPLPL